MRKLHAALVVVGLMVVALMLSSCGSGSSGKEGGTLHGTYASFPDYLDPGLSYTQEGLTAMYDTYIPLLTYARANGTAGGKVVPGLAESLPKIGDGGKTYTLTLRKGLKYSDGTPVKASDFTHAVERTIALNSLGSPFYATAIVGAEKFQKTKSGGISGIETNDKTGKIVIDLNAPRGTFTNELALLLVAPVPGDTPVKSMTADPPPATGPYVIVKSEPGKGWSYERNPQWAKNNAKLMPDLPSGHVDKIDIKVVRNQTTQVNEVEQGKSDWMQSLIPADRYAEVKSKYEGTQFRIEPTISTYYFWMNIHKAPFDDVKVRQAVNCAVSGAALERIYSGQLKANQQILPPGMPGYEEFELYPYDLAKAKQTDRRREPERPRRHRLDGQRKPQRRSRRILRGRAEKARLRHDAESPQRRQLLHRDRQRVDARPRHRLERTGSRTTRTRTTSSSRCWPGKASCRPTTATLARSTFRR